MKSTGNKPLLPQDIIINIFKRLPIKSIIRFRCVCKDWKNLFKTPHFIAEHTRQFDHENPLLLLIEYDYTDSDDEDELSREDMTMMPSYTDSDDEVKVTRPLSLRLINHKMESVEVFTIPRSLDFSFVDWQPLAFTVHDRLIGSCKGLLLVKANDLGCADRFHLCLWNPMIREVREIPQSTRKDYYYQNMYGLGFSKIVNDFKIVEFYMRHKRRHIHRVQVYSLSIGSWKELEFGALHNTTITSHGVSVDGTIVWLGIRDSLYVVVSFDIATEEFTLTPTLLPIKYPGRSLTSTILGVYQNKFSVCENEGGDSLRSIDSWVMEEVASESDKSFNCSKVHNFDLISTTFQTLCIWRNAIVCRDQDSRPNSKSSFAVKLFDITTKKKKYMKNLSSDYDTCLGCNYERSLVSVWDTQGE